MKKGVLFLAVGLLAPWCGAQTVTFPLLPSDCDRLPNGHTLITDSGSTLGGLQSQILEVDENKHLVKTFSPDILWAHNAEVEANGNMLISDTNHDRIVEIDPYENTVWDSASVSLSDGSTLNYPNDVDPLANGNLLITDRDNHRVVEVTRAGLVVWQFGVTGVPGSDAAHLSGPHNGDRLEDGSTIIADSNNNRVIRVDPSGAVLWVYAQGLRWPRDADYLDATLSSNGRPTVLITDSQNNRIIEVDYGNKNVVWSYSTDISQPYDADRLPGGNTLLSDSGRGRVVEVNGAGAIVWDYPPAVPLAERALTVTNPTSGAQLLCHIHEPEDAGPGQRYPGFILVPGGNAWGSQLDGQNIYETLAREGFVVMHFDPDGRGGSDGVEDYSGFIHQDGMHAVLQALAGLPEVDTSRIGVVTQSFGITVAAGALARFRGDPAVRFLIDFEGPASRCETAAVYGGHLNHDPADDPWWAEREALTFMRGVDARYFRIQTRVDHNPRLTDNHHCIHLVDAATGISQGGEGIAPWTRVNNGGMNPVDAVYSISPPWQCGAAYAIPAPPNYLYESTHLWAKIIQYLREAAACDDTPARPAGNTLMLTKEGAVRLTWLLAADPARLGCQVYRACTPLDLRDPASLLGPHRPTTADDFYDDSPPDAPLFYYRVAAVNSCYDEAE
jgi:hypothetical protein